MDQEDGDDEEKKTRKWKTSIKYNLSFGKYILNNYIKQKDIIVSKYKLTINQIYIYIYSSRQKEIAKQQNNIIYKISAICIETV